MTTMRIMAVFNGGTLLPEDRFVNVFHFSDFSLTDAYAALADGIRDRVGNFYTSTIGAGSIGELMSPFAQRNFTVVSYNMLIPPGERVPTSEIKTLPPALTGGGLPEEVAVCCTLEGAPPITSRRRGRIYIGPLLNNTAVITPATAFIAARPNISSNNLGNRIQIHAASLATTTVAMRWCIRSTTPTENYVPINSGYVDDAFDTQRRRGPDPSTRAVWTST